MKNAAIRLSILLGIYAFSSNFVLAQNSSIDLNKSKPDNSAAINAARPAAKKSPILQKKELFNQAEAQKMIENLKDMPSKCQADYVLFRQVYAIGADAEYQLDMAKRRSGMQSNEPTNFSQKLENIRSKCVDEARQVMDDSMKNILNEFTKVGLRENAKRFIAEWNSAIDSVGRSYYQEQISSFHRNAEMLLVEIKSQ